MRHSTALAISLVLLVLAFFLFIAGASCIPQVTPMGARITHFEPASGIYYPGGAVTSSLRFQNTGQKPMAFWVGYSVWDPAGQRYDVTSHQVALNSGEESSIQSKIWHVPMQSSCTSGDYKVAMALWDAAPEAGSAEQLAYREKQDAFLVLRRFEQFDVFDAGLWRKSNHQLERSQLDPNNVSLSNGAIRIKVPAGDLNGGEFGSIDYLKYGTYRTRMRVAPWKGAITGFFLYHGNGGGGDEIDIELYHDGEWQIAFTTWVKGNMTNTMKKAFEFDPSAEYHEYRIDFYPKQVRFFVDSKLFQEFNSGLPEEAMRLLVNTWFPNWLSGVAPATDQYTYIDWFQY